MKHVSEVPHFFLKKRQSINNLYDSFIGLFLLINLPGGSILR